jgi:hypothetical protein
MGYAHCRVAEHLFSHNNNCLVNLQTLWQASHWQLSLRVEILPGQVGTVAPEPAVDTSRHRFATFAKSLT